MNNLSWTALSGGDVASFSQVSDGTAHNGLTTIFLIVAVVKVKVTLAKQTNKKITNNLLGYTINSMVGLGGVWMWRYIEYIWSGSQNNLRQSYNSLWKNAASSALASLNEAQAMLDKTV